MNIFQWLILVIILAILTLLFVEALFEVRDNGIGIVSGFIISAFVFWVSLTVFLMIWF